MAFGERLCKDEDSELLTEFCQCEHAQGFETAVGNWVEKGCQSLPVSHVQGFVVLAPRFPFQVSLPQLFPLQFLLYLTLLTGLHDDAELDSIVVQGKEVLWRKRPSWRRTLAIFFLPLVFSGLGPHSEFRDDMFKVSPARFRWSRLTPSKLKERSVGLSTEKNAQGQVYFTLDGHKFMIIGGSIHYFRVPREYWKDRLLKLQACGFNTVTTYIPWNLHEQEKGKFDFSEILDLEYVIILLLLLFNHHLFASQYHHGGPVIAVQVENEYGSFGKDGSYMEYIKEALLKRGIVEFLLTSDNDSGMETGSVEGALTTLNMAAFEKDSFLKLQQMQNDKPIMVMEYWTGWYDTWGQRHNVKSATEIQLTVSRFLRSGISFNMYMFHGGTNFGFINGAQSIYQHRGVVTSYDYDAVLTEAGDYTEKYFKLRKLFASASAGSLPRLPPRTPKTVYPTVGLSFYLPLFEILPYLNKPVMLYYPDTMENLPINNGSGQPFGLVLYETSICSGGQLYAHVRDSAQVFLNDTRIGDLDEDTFDLTIPQIQDCQLLRILVENQGRVNFSWKIQHEWKGIDGNVKINGTLLRNFTIYSLDLKMSFFKRLHSATWRHAPEHYLGPAFYRGTLKAGSSPKDTFLDLSNWHYGFVFINGRNLGRYQDIGPQRTLYLPGPWLQPKDNEIIMFEMIEKGFYIRTTNKPQLQG
ncbi:beta-galactosidase-1-like protein 3 [Microtus ochrogaster]|uniref:Beta-galactosidase n=1 Tax=Microtus ochrogaster TaxID=79684 RepID=A0ABM0KJC9_MICOH|nr:beta-galactosidase-1-like protein 3 [Microtus ochrogaster]